ncbi:MAG: hypothetical protein HN952_07735 [Candidatus Cloacimonetes bacterium]|jgi:cytoskeletal protein RodZ|nr:hypothetical protein [Candidatus Cloacimonadota bacterium]MBT6994822.1 hypothetical protein [Candidatus Cloacimonadota bacterium]MBT7470194.1 hypothetical protein [Candidatus Cloacimonadota bacterium]
MEKINTIGELLKSERLKAGTSLAEVANFTKIKVRLLEEIEDNIFENLGGSGYAKAMMMNYARFLKLENKKILPLINQTLNLKTGYQRHDLSIQPKKVVLPGNILSIILLVFVVLTLTIFISFLFKSGTLSWPPFQEERDQIKIKTIEPKPLSENSKLEQLKSDENKVVENTGINEKIFEDSINYMKKFLKTDALKYDE